jgi:hypothetical protein
MSTPCVYHGHHEVDKCSHLPIYAPGEVDSCTNIRFPCRVSAEYQRAHPDTNFRNFPRLRHISVAQITKADIPVLSQPPIADAVTHLSLDLFQMRPLKLTAVPRLSFLPNLVGLTALHYPLHPAVPLPLTLVDLWWGDPVPVVNAGPLTRLTTLTSLRFHITGADGDRPFEALTTLSLLQRLNLVAGPPTLPLWGS